MFITGSPAPFIDSAGNVCWIAPNASPNGNAPNREALAFDSAAFNSTAFD
jgi:hypothetical protein